MEVVSFRISHLKGMGVKHLICRLLIENNQKGLKFFKEQQGNVK